MDELTKFVKEWKATQPDFPKNYCNPASHELQKILEAQWIETQKWFSYKNQWEWHVFLVDNEWNIIDPTYGQFDEKFPDGFYGKEFPDTEFEKNRTTDVHKALNIQKQRYEQWLFDILVQTPETLTPSTQQ